MEELMRQAQLEGAQPNDIVQVLLQIQKDVNVAFLSTQSPDYVTFLVGEIWRFLLFAAAHSVSSVRLASYRATGIFLLKITPFYPDVVKSTFSDVSMQATIDLKSSAIIAASFAFISRTISLPSLEKFLNVTPVYHDFASSDPIFSEHLASIISNIGELGFDWFQTLLHSFLALVGTSTDRYLLKSIAAIVKHYPMQLMNEILQFVAQQGNMKPYLALISFVIVSTKALVLDDLDLFDVALHALLVLEESDKSNLTEIDSAMQILSVRSKSFALEVTGVDAQTLKLVLTGRGGTKEVKFTITKYKDRPAFFMLRLPVEYCQPNLEKDGSLTLKAKLLCIASLVCEKPELAPNLFQLLEVHMMKDYCEIVSACMQAMSKCLPVLLERCDRKKICAILSKAIFAESQSWFHSSDILRVIDSISTDKYKELFGDGAEERIVDVLVGLCMSQNESVWKKALKSLVRDVRLESVERITQRICHEMDLFDPTSVTRSMILLSQIIEKFPTLTRTPLNSTLCQAIELCEIYKDDISVLTVVFEFISHFDINFETPSMRTCMSVVLSVITAELYLLSGEYWSESAKSTTLSACSEAVETDWQSMNLDIISDGTLGYEFCLRPLHAALKLFSAINPKLIGDTTVVKLCKKTLFFFPKISVEIINKCWPKLNLNDKLMLFKDAADQLDCIQSYDVAAILCKQFIMFGRKRDSMMGARDKLMETARFALKTKQDVTDFQLAMFKSLLYFLETDDGKEYSEDLEKEIGNYDAELAAKLFKQKIEKPETDLDLPPEENARVFQFRFCRRQDLLNFHSLEDPIVKTQLQRFTYTFQKDELQKLLNRYCELGDDAGAIAVLKYAMTKRIQIETDGKSVPLKAKEHVLRYHKKMGNPCASDIARSFLETPIPWNLTVLSVGCDPSQFLADLCSREKISKRDLRTLAIAAAVIRLPSDQLHEFFSKAFNSIESPKKLAYLLIALEGYLTTTKEVPRTSLSQWLNTLKDKLNELPAVQVARCVQVMIPLISQSRRGAVVDHFLNEFSPVSPMSAILLLITSKISDRTSVFERDAPSRAEEFFKRKIPSYFFAGMRLFWCALNSLPEKRIQSLMKHCLARIIRLFPVFMNLSGASTLVANSLARILVLPQFKKYHSQVLPSADKLIPPPSHPAFLKAHASCISEVVALTSGVKGMAEISAKMNTIVDALFTDPMTPSLMTDLVLVVGALAEKKSDTERQQFVLGKMKEWTDSMKSRDCYALADIIFSWSILLFRYCSSDNYIPVITKEFFEKTFRFLPVFIGVMKFLVELETSKASAEQIGAIEEGIREQAHVIEESCRAHALALELMTEPSTRKVARDLAKFDRDCNESEAIVTQFKPSLPRKGVDLLELTSTPVTVAQSFVPKALPTPTVPTPVTSEPVTDLLELQPAKPATALLIDVTPSNPVVNTAPQQQNLLENLPVTPPRVPSNELFEAITETPVSIRAAPAPSFSPDTASMFEVIPPASPIQHTSSDMFEPIVSSPSDQFEAIPPGSPGFEPIEPDSGFEPMSPPQSPSASAQPGGGVVDDLINF